MTPQLDSGTSFHAPARSPSGSETTSLASAESWWSTGLSGYWCLSVVTSVEKKSERDLPSLEYRNTHSSVPLVVATVIWMGCLTPWRRPVSSMNPTARSTAPGGSSSSPSVRAR